MAKNETLRIKIETDGAGKTKASLAGVEQGLTRVDGAGEKAGSGLSAARIGLAGFAAMATGAASAALVQLTRQTLQQAAALHALSQSYGVAVPRLSQLADIAQINGVQFQSFSAALGSLANKMQGSLVNPAGKAAQYFRALGVSVADADGNLRSVDNVLEDVARRFAGARDGAEKATIASELFGKQIGPQMVPLLNKFVDEMGRVNGSISTEFAAASSKFDENIARMSVGMKSFIESTAVVAMNTFNFMAENAIPGMGSAVRDVTEDLKKFEEWTKKTQIDLSEVEKEKQAKLAAAAAEREYNKALAEGMQIFEATRSPLEKLNLEYAQLDALLNAGIISFDTYARATFDASEAAETLNPLLREAQRVFDETRTPVERLASEIADLDELFAAGVITIDTYTRAVKKARDEAEKPIKQSKEEKDDDALRKEARRELNRDISDTFYGAMTGRFEDVNDAFRDMLRKMLADAVAAQITKAIFGDAGGSSNGNLISAGISLIAGALGPAPLLGPPGYADGGDFGAGRAMIVGERGPELMVPGASGTVIPNHRLGGGGVTINQSFDFRGAQPGESLRLRAEAERIKADTIATFYAQIERGGAAARVVGRR